jgi:hypothetical protein
MGGAAEYTDGGVAVTRVETALLFHQPSTIPRK